MSRADTPTVERLGTDLVTIAQCIVLDVGTFPHPSIPFDVGRQHPSSRVWIARNERGPVVAFLGALVRRELDVAGLAVDRRERRRGFGRALLREAMAEAARLGLPVVLHVSTSNTAAIALYRSEGFVARRRVARYYSRGLYAESGDALEMVWPRPGGSAHPAKR